MNRRPIAVSLFALLAFFSPIAAEAGPIWTINADAKGGVGQLETLTWSFNGASVTGLAGTITVAQIPGGKPFDAYCIDLYHDFYVGNGGTNWQVEVQPISTFAGDVGVPNGDAVGGNAGAIGYLYAKYAAGASTAIEGAALQVAIWKVEYDGNNNFSTGAFQFAPTGDPNSVQSQVYAQAVAYLAGFDGTRSNADASYLRATSHPNGMFQDFVGPGNLVPEPSSAVLVVLGLAGAAFARSRRARLA